MIYLYLGVGGAAGTIARYGLTQWALTRFGAQFPWGTLLVNVVGSLLIGFLARFLDGAVASQETRLLLTVGFCGAFTTFSTLSLEVLVLLQAGQWGRAGAYVLASLALGLAAVAVGFGFAGTMLRPEA